MLGFEIKNINLNFRFYRLTSVEKFALVYNFIMNSTHKHYSINNSRVAPASSHSFQNEQQLQYLDKYKQKHESSGSQKEEDQRFADKKPRISERNMNIGSSVAFSKHMITIQQKRKKLQKYKYINQLARMEYEDKLEQVYTKYTRQSKITATKKILAKNQIAEFIEEQQDENIGYDELLEFQYGKNKGQSFHFQKQQILDYDFCLFCDCIHNDHSQVHSVICERKRKEQPQLYSPYSDRYPKECLIRIKNASEKIKSREFQQLYTLINKLEKFSHQSPSILNRQKANIISSIKQLKQTYKSQDLFSKVIKKAHNILAKL